MKYYSLIFSFIFVFTFNTKAQQEPVYSQYMFNPTIINPAYCGIYDMVSATTLYRRQYLGLSSGEPNTFAFNAHTSLPINKMGAGITFVKDEIGINKTNKLEVIYSYRLDLGNNKLSFGMTAGFNQFISDPNGKLEANKIDDPFYISSRVSSTKPAFGIGAMYLSEKYFVGISVPSLKTQTIDEGENAYKSVKRHYFATAGYVIESSSSLKIKPSFLIRYVEGTPVSFDLNASVLLYQNLWTGLSFRKLNTLALMGQLQITDAVKVGASLDFALGNNAIKEVAAFEQVGFTGVSAFELMANFNFGLFDSQAVQTTVY